MTKPFVDEHRDRFGVEPICKVLQFAPSADRHHVARSTVERLMSRMGLQGEVRGKKLRTTIPDANALAEAIHNSERSHFVVFEPEVGLGLICH